MTLSDLLQSIPLKHRSEGILLASLLFGLSRSEFFLEPNKKLSEAQVKRWAVAWARRAKGEPIQYIAGLAPFYGRDFIVSPGVLIPRPETERLVEISLDLLAGIESPQVADIGAGSGVIGITIKLEKPAANVVLSDISTAALRTTRFNAKKLGAEVKVQRASGLKKLRSDYDLIVSNPPYLNFTIDRVSAEVKKWEPHLALEPGLDCRVRGSKDRGEWLAERFLRECALLRPRFSAFELSPRVAFALERKWRRHSAVARIWRESDLAGRKRFLLVAWKNA